MSKYYKIGMDFKFPTNEYEDGIGFSGNYVVSDNETVDSIIADVAESEGKSVDDFNITIKESSIEEFISEEKDMLKAIIRTRYLKRHNGDIENTLSIREYNNLVRAYTIENYLEALQEEARLNRFDKTIRKYVDTNTVTLAAYDCAIKSLFDAKDNEEFQSVITKLNPNVKF